MCLATCLTCVYGEHFFFGFFAYYYKSIGGDAPRPQEHINYYLSYRTIFFFFSFRVRKRVEYSLLYNNHTSPVDYVHIEWLALFDFLVLCQCAHRRLLGGQNYNYNTTGNNCFCALYLKYIKRTTVVYNYCFLIIHLYVGVIKI